MSEPLSAARGLEPDPVPDDLPANAPIRGDLERGYDRGRSNVAESSGSGTPRGSDDNRGSVARDASRSGVATPDKKGKGKEGKHGRGLTEGDAEMDEIPHNNMWLVMPSIGLCLFLAALDQTIVATALPTISEELHLSPSEYQWVGTAYLLAQTLQGPMNGRVSDIVGRKPMLYAAIVIFTVFSAFCGAAKTSSWLIIARAFQGLGGGAIIGLTSIVVSDICPLTKRGMYQGYLGLAWSVASVLGPILGGILTQRASWRWCFYINLPTCAIAFVCLLLSLKLNKTKKYTFTQLKHTFDFLGLLLVMAGGSLLVVGFAYAADHGFAERAAYGCIAAGGGVMAVAIVNCLYTKRNAIIPARLFKNRTTLFFGIGSLLQATAFLPANYLIPQLFQGVTGADALHSGLMLIPFAVSVSICTTIGGYINTHFRIVRPVAWFGYGCGGLGYALFYALYKYPIPLGIQEGIQIITGIGIGCSIVVPLIVLQSAMPLKDMAATTGGWSLTRSIGGSVGLAVFTAVLNTGIRSRFERIDGYGTEFVLPQSIEDYKQLHALPEGPIKDAVLTAFADAFRVCWIMAAAMMFAALAITLPTRSYSLNRSGGGGGKKEGGGISGDETPVAKREQVSETPIDKCESTEKYSIPDRSAIDVSAGQSERTLNDHSSSSGKDAER